MASAAIFICDKCESYMPEEQLHLIEITLAPHRPYHAKPASYTGPPTGSATRQAVKMRREICAQCAERLVESLKLDKRDDALKKELFDNFQLPAKVI